MTKLTIILYLSHWKIKSMLWSAVQSNITTAFYVAFLSSLLQNRKKVWIQLRNPLLSPRMGDDVGGGGKTISIGRDARGSPVPTAWSLQVWPKIQGHHERALSPCLWSTNRSGSWTTSPGRVFQGLDSLSPDWSSLGTPLDHFWQICFISAQTALVDTVQKSPFI